MHKRNFGDGNSVKRWKRRSRLVAREFAFAEGKRDDILRALKLLPTKFLQRISEEEEAREGEGAFSRILGCLDVKGACLRVPQKKPLKVILRVEEFLAKRNLPGQRVGAKAWKVFCYKVGVDFLTVGVGGRASLQYQTQSVVKFSKYKV